MRLARLTLIPLTLLTLLACEPSPPDPHTVLRTQAAVTDETPEEFEARLTAFVTHVEALRAEAIQRWIAWHRAVAYAQAIIDAEAARDPYGATGDVNGYPCGGALPPCEVLWGESKGNPTATNPNSSASGLWQFIDGTWAGYGGYRRAMHAPVAVQNAKAAALWDHGRGCSHWRATTSLC